MKNPVCKLNIGTGLRMYEAKDLQSIVIQIQELFMQRVYTFVLGYQSLAMPLYNILSKYFVQTLYSSLAFISSSEGTQYTSFWPQSQPLFVFYLVLTWTQAQFKLLQQPCHEHSSLELCKCLPNAGPWAK